MLRVAAYCRVSTDSNDQANSLASQEKYFRDYIARNPDWELAQVFVDTGITGTSTKKRAAFNRMIAEALAGNFHLILTKEISRFARNTMDSIYFTRKLREMDVGVIFMNDNINTLDPDAELRLTIMSSIAQEESRKTSDRVKWGQKRRMEQGVVFGRDMLGYDVRNGKLSVNEKGAETVRLIFHKFVQEGKGAHVIARELREAGIPTATYMKEWSNTVILRVLRNEKYCGDLIQKKTITPNYLNHDKKYNKGEEELVVLHDHHEPIISRELFERAGRELQRRAPSPEQTSRHSNRYCFSGRIKCAVCGCSFVSRTKKRKDGSVYKAWRCYQAASRGSKHLDSNGEEVGCNCPSVNDEELKLIMQAVVKSLRMGREVLIKTVGDAVEQVLGTGAQADPKADSSAKANLLTVKMQGLIDLLLAREITKLEFRQMKERYERDLAALKQEQAERERNDLPQKSQRSMMCDIRLYLSELIAGDRWDDAFYRNLLDVISVAEDNTLTVSLKLLPEPWNAVLRGDGVANRRHSDASVPISVNTALHSS